MNHCSIFWNYKYFCKRFNFAFISLSELENSLSPNLSWLIHFWSALFSRFGKYFEFFHLHLTICILHSRSLPLFCIQLYFLISSLSSSSNRILRASFSLALLHPVLLLATLCLFCCCIPQSFVLQLLRGEKLNYKSVAKEISKPPFLVPEGLVGIKVYRVCSIDVSFKCFEPCPYLVCHVTTIENV